MQIIYVGIANLYEAKELALNQYKDGRIEQQSPLSVDEVKKYAIDGTFIKSKNIYVNDS